MITIHLWGYDSTCQPSLISPESIALYWFLEETAEGEQEGQGQGQGQVLRKDIEIVFSNNPSLSPNYHLPLLIDKQGTTANLEEESDDTFKKPVILSGYDNIIRYLTTGSHDDAMSSALLQFVADDIGSLTEWALYLNKNNYNNFTRPEHARLLRCEQSLLQRLLLGSATAATTTAMSVRAAVLKRLKRLNKEEPEEPAELKETAPEDLAQSKVFKLQLESRQRVKRELQDFTDRTAYLSRLVDAVQRWREATGNSGNNIPSGATAARLLLLANLRVQFSLPDTGAAARDRLSAEFTEEFVQRLMSMSMSLHTTPVHHRAPLYWTEMPNFVSSALNWCYYRWSRYW